MLNILLMLASLWAVGSTQVTLQQQTCSDASQKATIKPGAEALIGGFYSNSQRADSKLMPTFYLVVR
jgi:hypothetical protein